MQCPSHIIDARHWLTSTLEHVTLPQLHNFLIIWHTQHLIQNYCIIYEYGVRKESPIVYVVYIYLIVELTTNTVRDRVLHAPPNNYGEKPPLSKPSQSGRSSTTNRSNKGVSRPQRGSGVYKTRSSSNLSASRMDLIALATEAELKRSALPTVTESIHEVENQHPASHTAKSKAVYSRELITDRVSRDAPQTALKDALQRISLLEEELKLARAKTKEAERARNKMFKDLAAATKIEATLYDDSHFKEEVQQLRYRVYNWVKNRKWKVASQGQRRAYTALNQYDFLCTTCPSYQDYLGTKEGVHLLIEAHIWQCLVQNVFNCNLWAETRDQKLMKPTDLSDNPFTELKKALSIKYPQF